VADGGEDGVGGIAGSSLEVAVAGMALSCHVAGGLGNPRLPVHLADRRATLSNLEVICASENFDGFIAYSVLRPMLPKTKTFQLSAIRKRGTGHRNTCIAEVRCMKPARHLLVAD
jgi:hypothetical protein